MQKVDINQKDENGRTRLHDACNIYDPRDLNCLLTEVRSLLDLGADINAQDQDGFTPLHFACKWRDTYLARLLLDRGADVNIRDNCQNTPLHAAYYKTPYYPRNRHCQILPEEKLFPEKELYQIILDLGADINAQNEDGNTPLHTICYSYYGPALCDHNDHKFYKDKHPISFVATIVDLLAYISPQEPNLNIKNKEGETVLDYFRENYPELVTIFYS